ncbi:TolC family outer membrane protein [Paramixta manurensis]|uniref:TolC family outer membrane protein n=1 Tax=Paramixta manurensis TaxID=2740817 RepID=A0A6M8UB06_9GAMM|nr:TolC family outer membrane protein [Erwiniaceae bacterium PD-1]
MKFRISFFIGLFISHSATADTLLDAVRAAGASNAEIQAAIYQQLAGNEKRWQGLAGLLPTIQLGGSYTQQDQPRASYAAKVTRHDSSISLSQPLFDLTKYADYMRGKAMSESAEIELMKAQEKLISDVADAYANVLYQQEVLNAARHASKAYQHQLAQAQAAIKLGDATRIDIDEAQANLDVSQAKVIEAENELLTAGAQYQRLTGLNYAHIEAISPHCLLQNAPEATNSEKALFNQALAHNVDIKQAITQLNIAKSDVFATHSAHLPVVRFQASYGTNWSRGEGENELDRWFGTTSKTTNTNVGVTVSVPLFSGGLQLSQSREAVYKKEQARYQLIDIQQKIKQELRTSTLNIHNGRMLLTSSQKVIQSEGNKVNSTLKGKEMGLRTQMDELNARQRYYEAVKNNAEARYKLLTAKLTRARILGELGHLSLAKITCSN